MKSTKANLTSRKLDRFGATSALLAFDNGTLGTTRCIYAVTILRKLLGTRSTSKVGIVTQAPALQKIFKLAIELVCIHTLLNKLSERKWTVIFTNTRILQKEIEIILLHRQTSFANFPTLISLHGDLHNVLEIFTCEELSDKIYLNSVDISSLGHDDLLKMLNKVLSAIHSHYSLVSFPRYADFLYSSRGIA